MRTKKVGITAFMNDYIVKLYRLDIKKFVTNARVFLDFNMKVFEKYDFDSPPFSYDVYNIEAEALGQELLWLGNQLPEVRQDKRLIRERGDIKRLKPPKPGISGRMPFISDVIRGCMDRGVDYNIRFCGPFTLACNIRGYQELIMDILEDPIQVHLLFTFLTDEVLSPWIEFQRNIVGEKVYALGADAMSSLPLVSPAIMEEFALKYILRLQQNIGNVGTRAWRGESTQKNPRKILDFKLRANPKFLDCVDPDVHNLGPKYFSDYAKEKNIPLVFGIDPIIMERGSTDEIKERILNYMLHASEANKLRIHLMHVPSSTPEQNVKTAVETVRNFNKQEFQETKTDL